MQINIDSSLLGPWSSCSAQMIDRRSRYLPSDTQARLIKTFSFVLLIPFLIAIIVSLFHQKHKRGGVAQTYIWCFAMHFSKLQPYIWCFALHFSKCRPTFSVLQCISRTVGVRNLSQSCFLLIFSSFCSSLLVYKQSVIIVSALQLQNLTFSYRNLQLLILGS